MSNIKFRVFINGKYLMPANDEVAITQNGRIILLGGKDETLHLYPSVVKVIGNVNEGTPG